jgi:predicted glutamine amidotransferase
MTTLKSSLKLVHIALGVALLSLLGSPLTYACRLQAIMSPKGSVDKTSVGTTHAQKQTTAFLKQTLLTAPNSLLNESKKRPKLHRVEEKNSLYDLEDLSGLVRSVGSPDGWGITSYNPLTPEPQTLKSALPAEKDPNYALAINTLIKNKPNLVMAHVRQTDNPKSVAIQNVHPFMFHNWSLIHNGAMMGAFAQSTLDKIASHQEALAGGPKGQTDSERVLHYFLSVLLEKYDTTDSSKLSTEQVQTAFQQTMSDLIKAAPAKSKPFKDSLFGLEGTLQTLPSCNVVISDGQHIYAFRRVLNLYLGEKDLGHGETLYIVSSERSIPASKSMKWLLLPENHFLTLSWNIYGHVILELNPY